MKGYKLQNIVINRPGAPFVNQYVIHAQIKPQSECKHYISNVDRNPPDTDPMSPKLKLTSWQTL